jgi:hypothetical protein
MWLFLRTFTALWAPDSLWTHIRTSPKAPDETWLSSLTLTCAQNFSNSVKAL